MNSASHSFGSEANGLLPGVRTGTYQLHLDGEGSSGDAAIDGGIYNEDMAVAIVDEVENKKLTFKHWSCTGEIGLKEW